MELGEKAPPGPTASTSTQLRQTARHEPRTREPRTREQKGLCMNPAITRRHFLECAASATAVFLAARPASAQSGMFVSLNGSLTPGVSGADRARLAAKLGYGGVDWDF